MIFFGTRGKVMEIGEPIEDFECPHCGNLGMNSVGAIRYFHIYWIPMFVTKRSAVMICPHCKYNVADDELDSGASKALRSIVFGKNKLIGYNLGLYAFLMLFAYFSISSVFVSIFGSVD